MVDHNDFIHESFVSTFLLLFFQLHGNAGYALCQVYFCTLVSTILFFSAGFGNCCCFTIFEKFGKKISFSFLPSFLFLFHLLFLFIIYFIMLVFQSSAVHFLQHQWATTCQYGQKEILLQHKTNRLV